jgi:hypothetical protein
MLIVVNDLFGLLISHFQATGMPCRDHPERLPGMKFTDLFSEIFRLSAAARA